MGSAKVRPTWRTTPQVRHAAGGTGADGQAAKVPLDVPARHHVGGATGREAVAVGLLAESEDRPARDGGRAEIPMVLEAEGVIQRAGGHADLCSWGPATPPQVERACPPLPTPGALPSDEPGSASIACAVLGTIEGDPAVLIFEHAGRGDGVPSRDGTGLGWGPGGPGIVGA